MKKFLFIVLLLSLLLVLAVPVAMADGHECTAPGKAHQSYASCLKGGVSDLVPEHVSNAGGNGGGMPAAHGMTGAEFGAAVSAAAPVNGHVSGR